MDGLKEATVDDFYCLILNDYSRQINGQKHKDDNWLIPENLISFLEDNKLWSRFYEELSDRVSNSIIEIERDTSNLTRIYVIENNYKKKMKNKFIMKYI